MKTLNRPMFRYGGPIKEGIMDGIREPKRNGGSMMGNDEGPRRAALVGNPIYPQGSDGRTRHVIPMAIGTAARFLAPAFGKFVTRKALPMLNKAGKNMYKKGMPKIKKNQRFEEAREGFDPNAVGRFFVNDPLAKAAVTGSNFAGKAIQKVGGGIKYATTTPSGLLFLGAPVTYSAGKYFLNSGEEIKGKDLEKITQGGKKPGENSDMYQEKQPPTAAEIEAAEAEARMKQMDRYREIIDIKGMNKDAAYKSLIDASKIIQEGGNLKKSLKDGSLISKVTAAASKRFDKVSDTENALRSLVVKGEIDNELNKVDKDLKRRALEGQIKVNEKALAGDSFDEAILKKITSNQGKMPTGSDLAGILKATRKIDSVVLDGSQVTAGGEVKFVQDSVVEKQKQGESTNPGYYVINNKIVIVDEQGNVSQYY
jgi:hypothetical protein